MIKKKEERKEMNHLFYNRMRELGYDDITAFSKSSNVDISFETVRRAIHDNRQDIRYEYVVALMQALDFTPAEISEELVRRGDEHLHKLISASAKGMVLTDQERAIINGIRKRRQLIPVIIQILELVQ